MDRHGSMVATAGAANDGDVVVDDDEDVEDDDGDGARAPGPSWQRPQRFANDFRVVNWSQATVRLFVRSSANVRGYTFLFR